MYLTRSYLSSVALEPNYMKRIIVYKCQRNAVGDETHFFIVCKKFSDDRKTLFELVENEVTNFRFLDIAQKCSYLLSS